MPLHHSHPISRFSSLSFSLSSRSQKYLSLFVECADWSFSHLCDAKRGEWFGYADRDGAVTHRFKGGPYKGCFHVPRSLFMCENLLAKAIGKVAGK
jgi:N-acylglucosamine 2-epimerase